MAILIRSDNIKVKVNSAKPVPPSAAQVKKIMTEEFRQRHKNCIYLDKESLRVQLLDYDPDTKEKVKLIAKESGVKPSEIWDPLTKTWKVRLIALDELVKALPGFKLQPCLQDEIDRLRAREARNASMKLELEKLLPIVNEPFRSGKIPFQHQKQAVQRMIQNWSIILADDMGLGKTASTLLAAKIFQKALGYTVCVITKVSLLINWQREADDIGVGVFIYPWSKIPKPEHMPDNFVLILDEAHMMQNMKTQRTSAALLLTISARAVFCVTGTPIKNGRPANLFPLLKAVKHSLATNRTHYECRYCDAGPTSYSQWDAKGCSNLLELYDKTRDIILRRMKHQCLDLPKVTRVMKEVEFTIEQQKEYDALLKKMEDAWKETVRLKSMTLPDNAEDGAEYLGADLAELGRLRRCGSLVKTATAIEEIEEILEQGSQAVVSCEFIESAEAIAKHFQVHALTGSMKADRRQQVIDLFQSGKQKVFVMTGGAGGEGINLTKANFIILVDRPWTPGGANQIECRVDRIGQTSPVTSIWLQAGKIDRKVDKILEEKAKNINQVLAGQEYDQHGVKTVIEKSFFGKPLRSNLQPEKHVEQQKVKTLQIQSTLGL